MARSRTRACALLLSSLLAAACTDPPPVPPVTLGSPVDVAAVRVCVVPADDDPAVLTFLPAEACEADDETQLRTRVAVANTRDRVVHVVETDRRPGIVNFLASVPGVTGLHVDGTPVSVAALRSAPSILLVGLADAPGLAAVDTALGRPVRFRQNGQTRRTLELGAAPTQLRTLDDGRTVIWLERNTSSLVFASVTYGCGVRGEVHATDCTSELALAITGRLRLDAPPLAWTADEDGMVWVTREDREDLLLVGAFGPALAACGGAPCVADRVAAGRECANGLDDDRDGFIDADDPQCFEPAGREDGRDTFFDRVFQCTDGLDNDADGFIDADDRGCAVSFMDDERDDAAGRPACENGLDDDLDGFIDTADPGCAATGGRSESEDFAPMAELTTLVLPICSNGLDDDNDGVIDYPLDTGCYGPSTGSETTPVGRRLVSIDITPEQDLILVADATTPQALIIDRLTRTRIAVNEGRNVVIGEGVQLPTGQPATLVAGTLRSIDLPLRDGRRLQSRDRVAFLPMSIGFTVPVELDRTWVEVAADGTETILETQPRWRRRDLDASAGRVRAVSCRLPRDAAEQLNDVRVDCEDNRLPRPVPQDPSIVESDDAPYTVQPGDGYATFPREPAYIRSEDERSIERIDLPFDWDLAGDRWRVTWEGVLPGTLGDDGVFLDDTGLLASLGTAPCTYGLDPCQVGLDLSECPDVAALCQRGDNLCLADQDFCTLCRSACRQGADFCASGVLPGDRVLIDRIDSRGSLPDVCSPYLRQPDAVSGEVEVRALEYLVTDVRPGRLQLAQVPADRLPASSVSPPVPPRACFPEPFTYRVRAGASFVFEGATTWGHPSPNLSVGDACVPRRDAFRRGGRPRLDAPFVSLFGLGFEIRSGTAPPLRDFALEFDLRAGFADRAVGGIELLRNGITSRTATFFRSRFGDRLVIADPSLDTLWVYQGPTFVQGSQVR